MTHKDDPKTALRSSYIRRGFKSAKFQFPMGNVGVFMQVTLAVIYMYLILLGYQMMGVTGVALVSVLFLLALFSPIIYQLVRINRQNVRDADEKRRNRVRTDEEVEQFRRLQVEEGR